MGSHVFGFLAHRVLFVSTDRLSKQELITSLPCSSSCWVIIKAFSKADSTSFSCPTGRLGRAYGRKSFPSITEVLLAGNLVPGRYGIMEQIGAMAHLRLGLPIKSAEHLSRLLLIAELDILEGVVEENISLTKRFQQHDKTALPLLPCEPRHRRLGLALLFSGS